MFTFYLMTPAPIESALRLKTLGPSPRLVRIGAGGEESPVFGPGKPLAILIYLSLRPDRTASRSHLTDLLWADSDLERARQSLRQAIWQIRHKLGDVALAGDGERITLEVPLAVDYLAVGTALGVEDFEQAVKLYAGDFLGEFGVPGGAGFEHWADKARDRLRTGWMWALDSLARDRLSRGAVREAIAFARQLRDADPLQESAWRFLLEALLLGGDSIGAVVEADELEALLARERREPEPQTVPFLKRVRSLPPAAGAAARTALTAELIGREGEFKRITQAWERARVGEGRHIHLSARAGLGKTRLLRDAERRLRAMGGRVLYLRASPGSRQISYAFAAELARALIAIPGASGVAPAVMATILALDPSLGSTYQGTPDPSEGAEALRRRTLALADMVLALSEDSPLALLLDDVHWMDRESLQVLAGMLPRLSGAAALVVSAARPFQDRQAVEADAELLSLAPLDESQVEALVMSLAPLPDIPWARALISRLHDASGGSPHLALESLQLALDRGWLTLENHRWSCADPSRIAIELPAGDSLWRRVEGLDGPSRQVLALLAVAAAPLGGDVLARAAGLSDAEAAPILSGLEVRGFVALSDHRWRLGHDELSGVALRGQTPEAIQRLSARVGNGLMAEPSLAFLDHLRAAELLVAGADEAALQPLYRRWLAAAHRLRDPRTDTELARALLGVNATPDRLRRLLRARPLHRRLGLDTGPKRWGAATAGLLMVGALALVADRASTRPARMELLQAPLSGSTSTVMPTPIIGIQDASGRRVRDASVSVQVEIVGQPGMVFGRTTVEAKEGVATFDQIAFREGFVQGSTLRFSARGMPPIEVNLPQPDAVELWLDAAELNGQALTPTNRELHLDPGETIQGEVSVRYTALWPAASVILAAIPTWGDKRTNFINVSALPTPVMNGLSRHHISIPGPDAPGDYFLVLAFAAETDAKWIASGTNWSIGAPVWDDGNDLADLTAGDVAVANARGVLHPEWIFKNGREPGTLPATVLRVEVR